MATPPFTGDTSNPADNGIVSQFPTNERTHRDEIISYLDTEHDATTGYHKFQLLSTTAKNALTTPPAGMLVYDSTLGQFQINTGTSGSPVWTAIGPVQAVPTGAIFMWGPGAAPAGYLLLDGSAVSRTTYATLFAQYGTTFGAGDGSTTFNLPNFQRRVAVGAGGSGTGVLGSAVGNTGGEETHTQTVSEMPSHNHGVNDPTHSHAQEGDTALKDAGAHGGVWETGSQSPANGIGGTTAASGTGISIQNNGGGAPFNVMQPSIVVNFIVKT